MAAETMIAAVITMYVVIGAVISLKVFEYNIDHCRDSFANQIENSTDVEFLWGVIKVIGCIFWIIWGMYIIFCWSAKILNVTTKKSAEIAKVSVRKSLTIIKAISISEKKNDGMGNLSLIKEDNS